MVASIVIDLTFFGVNIFFLRDVEPVAGLKVNIERQGYTCSRQRRRQGDGVPLLPLCPEEGKFRRADVLPASCFEVFALRYIQVSFLTTSLSTI